MDGKQSSFVEGMTQGFCTGGGTVRRKLFFLIAFSVSLVCKLEEEYGEVIHNYSQNKFYGEFRFIFVCVMVN